MCGKIRLFSSFITPFSTPLVGSRRLVLVRNMPVFLAAAFWVIYAFALWRSLIFVALGANGYILPLLLTFLYVLTCHKNCLVLMK
jgi:hypothetical protein